MHPKDRACKVQLHKLCMDIPSEPGRFDANPKSLVMDRVTAQIAGSQSFNIHMKMISCISPYVPSHRSYHPTLTARRLDSFLSCNFFSSSMKALNPGSISARGSLSSSLAALPPNQVGMRFPLAFRAWRALCRKLCQSSISSL